MCSPDVRLDYSFLISELEDGWGHKVEKKSCHKSPATHSSEVITCTRVGNEVYLWHDCVRGWRTHDLEDGEEADFLTFSDL